MTLLIIGGLLAVAFLAILGAIFLSLNDQRAEKARTNGGAIVSSPTSTPLAQQSSASNRITERSTTLSQNLTPPTERPLDITEAGQQPYALNGQFHELAVELQTLYQHAWELERRLRTLSEVADRIEKTQVNQIPAEE